MVKRSDAAATTAASRMEAGDHPGTCMAPGCSAGVQFVTAVSGKGTKRGYCSTAHYHATEGGRLMRVCPQCRTRFDARAAGIGRPATYCTPACKQAMERTLRKATVELARSVQPDSGEQLDAQLHRAELLLSVWGKHRGAPVVVMVRDLVDRFWPDGVPPVLAPPEPAAVSALAGRVAMLRNLATERDRQRRKREQEAQAKAEHIDAVKAAGVRRVAGESWKSDLLRGDGDESS